MNLVKTSGEFAHQPDASPLFSQASIQAVPTWQQAPMMVEQSACECHYGNDMKLERKQSGSAQINRNKNRQGESKMDKKGNET